MTVIESTGTSSTSVLVRSPAQSLANLLSQSPTGQFICVEASGLETTKTYHQLWAKSTRLLAGLRSLGLAAGTPIVFQLSERHDFVTAFWSCLLGGFIPVPMSVDRGKTSTAKLSKQLSYILGTLKDAVVLSDSQLSKQVQGLLFERDGTKQSATVVDINSLDHHQPDTHFHHARPDDLALFLLSSGTTTGQSKIITFDAQTVTRRLLTASTQQQNVYLGWLPLHSIGGLKLTIPKSIKKVHISTEGLLQKPLMFLDYIQKHQVTHASATNFFLNLLNQQLEQSGRQWNLSKLQLVSVGAEAVVVDTVLRAITLLTPHKLPTGVIRPAYGMSECGLLAVGDEHSFTNSTFTNSTNQALSGSYAEIGRPTPDHKIRIVGAENVPLTEGKTGRIQVKGPTMTAGYYQPDKYFNKQNNKQRNDLHVQDPLFTPDGWLDTGDLGHLRQGRLTVTGRSKEIVIINALNVAIADIEQALATVEGITPGCTIACGVRPSESDTDELLICFTPTSPAVDLIALIDQMRHQLSEKMSINPRYWLPIVPEEIPRTQAGKVQRSLLKHRFELGEFDSIIQSLDRLLQQRRKDNYSAPTTSTEETLADIFAQVLSLKQIGIHDNFFAAGGNSLLATQVVSRMRETLSVALPLRTLFESPTIATLASALERLSTQSSEQSVAPIVRRDRQKRKRSSLPSSLP